MRYSDGSSRVLFCTFVSINYAIAVLTKGEFMANYAGGIIKPFSEERRYVNETIKKGSGMDDSLFKDMGKCGNVTPLLNLGCKTDGLIFAF